jgi:aryl-alcohol dehydrogenase-like predicted oxidoreductase
MPLTPLALGTVQFGMAYGVANAAGQPSAATVQTILDTARAAGIDMLDTAEMYGEAETVLGRSDTDGFQIVTKLGEIAPGENFAPRFAACLTRLNRKSVHGLLLHRPGGLLDKGGDQLWAALETLKGAGKLGASTYTPEETEALLDRFPLGLVQLPLAPIDGRWDATLERLAKAGVEVHTRSALLQGLLAMPADTRPDHFKPWQTLLVGWDTWCADHNLDRAAAALALVRTRDSISRVVVGVDSRAQLIGLLDGPTALPNLPSELTTQDPNLLNPALWC